MSASQKELREAYKAGLFMAYGFTSSYVKDNADSLASLAYPPKMVTRPREIPFGDNRKVRVRDGVIEHSYDSDTWHSYFGDELNAVLADLFANPTEQVEDEDA